MELSAWNTASEVSIPKSSVKCRNLENGFNRLHLEKNDKFGSTFFRHYLYYDLMRILIIKTSFRI